MAAGIVTNCESEKQLSQDLTSRECYHLADFWSRKPDMSSTPGFSGVVPRRSQHCDPRQKHFHRIRQDLGSRRRQSHATNTITWCA